ncbi:hypothetical protein GOODEAATRI_000095 [Goodea atripinnis]|uniref:Uncharacterized protein n=1 Tax=Goodea atripinnis TaxID=208336 RepID=A0ABV0NQQ1_9TELE
MGDSASAAEFFVGIGIVCFLYSMNVKDATDTEGIGASLALCKGGNITCEVTNFANMRTLNISVVRRNARQQLG